jgi:hypothetical protein
MSGFQDDDRLSALETQIRAQFPAEEEVKILRRAVAYLLKSVSQLLPEAGLREMGATPGT